MVCLQMTLQPDLQPPGGEDVGVEGHLGGGAAGVVQHHAGDGAAVPLQEARLGDLLRASQLQLKQPEAGRPRPRLSVIVVRSWLIKRVSSSSACCFLSRSVRRSVVLASSGQGIREEESPSLNI